MAEEGALTPQTDSAIRRQVLRSAAATASVLFAVWLALVAIGFADTDTEGPFSDAAMWWLMTLGASAGSTEPGGALQSYSVSVRVSFLLVPVLIAFAVRAVVFRRACGGRIVTQAIAASALIALAVSGSMMLIAQISFEDGETISWLVAAAAVSAVVVLSSGGADFVGQRARVEVEARTVVQALKGYAAAVTLWVVGRGVVAGFRYAGDGGSFSIGDVLAAILFIANTVAMTMWSLLGANVNALLASDGDPSGLTTVSALVLVEPPRVPGYVSVLVFVGVAVIGVGVAKRREWRSTKMWFAAPILLSVVAAVTVWWTTIGLDFSVGSDESSGVGGELFGIELYGSVWRAALLGLCFGVWFDPRLQGWLRPVLGFADADSATARSTSSDPVQPPPSFAGSLTVQEWDAPAEAGVPQSDRKGSGRSRRLRLSALWTRGRRKWVVVGGVVVFVALTVVALSDRMAAKVWGPPESDAHSIAQSLRDGDGDAFAELTGERAPISSSGTDVDLVTTKTRNRVEYKISWDGGVVTADSHRTREPGQLGGLVRGWSPIEVRAELPVLTLLWDSDNPVDANARYRIGGETWQYGSGGPLEDELVVMPGTVSITLDAPADPRFVQSTRALVINESIEIDWMLEPSPESGRIVQTVIDEETRRCAARWTSPPNSRLGPPCELWLGAIPSDRIPVGSVVGLESPSIDVEAIVGGGVVVGTPAEKLGAITVRPSTGTGDQADVTVFLDAVGSIDMAEDKSVSVGGELYWILSE